MLRLFAYSPELVSAGIWRQVAQRVRGVELSVGDQLDRILNGTEDCQAVAITRAVAPRPATVERLLLYGKHVLLVDLPASQPEEMSALLQLAEKTSARLKVVNSHCYQPSRRLIKQQIADHLGPPGLLRSHRWEPAAAELPPAIAGLPAGLVDDLDQAVWLFGRPADRIYAVEHRLPDQTESAGRYLQVHLGFGEGMALIDYGNRLPAERLYQSLSVIGFSGAAYAEDDENMQLAFRGGKTHALPTTANPVLAWTTIVQEFAVSVAKGGDLSPAMVPRQAFALADAVSRSLTSRQAISVEGCPA